MISNKFDPSKRTFETRVSFIRDIFSNKYEPTDILAHSIEYKLGRSYKNYLYEINASVWSLYGEDPLKVLKKIDQ